MDTSSDIVTSSEVSTSEISTESEIDILHDIDRFSRTLEEGSPRKDLIDLFKAVIEYGKQVRSKRLDGLAEWNKIKPLFSPEKICEWSIVRKIGDEDVTDLDKIYEYVHDWLGMKGGDDDEKTPVWEKYHFFLQLIRIAKNNPECSLLRLMQIAYNIGQLKAEYDDPVYTENVKEFYDLNNLGDIDSYVDSSKVEFPEEDLADIRSKVEKETPKDEIKGGGSIYFHKYLKYKSKYLGLKNR